ncbi:MAG TPA: hypothetical protein VMF51_18265 [Nocardioides sp.]|uniref:hypothetical protein n=1 Tax=Nocardioides sp. TaxID=35761 RepID=UPI002CCF2890|nr:hypothetical protein [Nocardioides sp.]HTW17081.1 hypothetical protein [Nocardioides sp.]
MSRPQIIVNVTGALPRRGDPTPTGTCFMVYAGADGPAVPTKCLSSADATAANVPDTVAALVGDALEQGAPLVVIVRAAAANVAAVTEAEWTAGLRKLTKDHGPGQVCIPGVTTAAAYAALIDHAEEFDERAVLLDTPAVVVTATTAAAAAGLNAAAGSIRASMVGPWVTVPGPGGTTRDVPASVIAAGLAARGDAAVGHTNHAPIFDQGRDVGLVRRGLGVTTVFSDVDADTLYDAGVNLIRLRNGKPTLTGWRSLSDDDTFRQFNVGRLAMSLVTSMSGVMLAFLGRQIDGRGQLFAEIEGAIRGVLLGLYSAGALYGEAPDDAFDADCSFANNPAETIALGQVHAAAEVAATAHTERITIAVVTAVAEGAAA